MKKQEGKCGRCELFLTSLDLVEVHHIDGNHKNNKETNLTLLHRHCHDHPRGQHEGGAIVKRCNYGEPCESKGSCTVL